MNTEQIDKSNMQEVILNSPNQLKEGLSIAGETKIEGVFENIIICGIGGSALPANILLCWLREKIKKSKSDVPLLYIHRDYNLPPETNEKSLVICISYSGNTEEPLSALKEAIEKKYQVITISSGGKFEEMSKEKNIPYIKVPSGIQPRCATGYLFSILIKVLENSGILEGAEKELLEAGKELEKTDLRAEGKKIAEILKGKIPLVYASNELKCLARIWKIKFNENSKIPAFYNYFPELNHNEMVGFTDVEKTRDLQIIILRDKEKDLPRIQKRMELFAELMKEKNIGVEFVDIKKGNLLFKIFSTLLLGDWTSYYLALQREVDPTPVKIVEQFKKKLKE